MTNAEFFSYILFIVLLSGGIGFFVGKFLGYSDGYDDGRRVAYWHGFHAGMLLKEKCFEENS